MNFSVQRITESLVNLQMKKNFANGTFFLEKIIVRFKNETTQEKERRQKYCVDCSGFLKTEANEMSH